MLLYVDSEVLTSDKGYEWTTVKEIHLSVDQCFASNGLTIFTSTSYNSGILVSQDGGVFKELSLEDGRWLRMAGNDDGMLAVFSANNHEETELRVGRYIYQETL